MNFSREEQNLAQATPVEPPAEARRRSIRPLFSMIPFFARYRMRAFAALVALLVASLATLAVPIAVRRMIDFGFSEERIGLIDQYFAVLIAVAAVLAAASALRYYLVTTIGERVVADLRATVFDHLTGLSAAFFDSARSGELVSRLTADTVADAIHTVPLTGRRQALYISGGGAHNPAIVERLQQRLPTWSVAPMSALGVHGDAKEAVLFAALANETVAGSAKKGEHLGGIPLISMGKISFPG